MDADERRIATFFYGSFMDWRVLRSLKILVHGSMPAMLPGFRIELRPRVNLRVSDRDVVYGAVMHLTRAELARLYDLSPRELIARGVPVPDGPEPATYQPEPVMVKLRDGSWRTALCYVAEAQTPGTPSSEYVESVIAAARALDLPQWYVDHLGTFGLGGIHPHE